MEEGLMFATDEEQKQTPALTEDYYHIRRKPMDEQFIIVYVSIKFGIPYYMVSAISTDGHWKSSMTRKLSVVNNMVVWTDNSSRKTWRTRLPDIPVDDIVKQIHPTQTPPITAMGLLTLFGDAFAKSDGSFRMMATDIWFRFITETDKLKDWLQAHP